MCEEDLFALVAQRIVANGELQRSWPLAGGVSAAMHAIEVKDPGGQTHRFVIRQHQATDWRLNETGVTAREYALLEALRLNGLEAPQPVRLDQSGEILPTPYLVLEYIDGTTTVEPENLEGSLLQMAAFLARLHAVDTDDRDLPQLPDLEDPVAGALEYLSISGQGAGWRPALEQLQAGSRARFGERRALLHGDFWPHNVLWRDGKIAAVIDWEDATFGDPLSDLAACRVELLCYYGEAAMESFTKHYKERGRWSIDPLRLELAVWELYVSAAALATMGNWGLEAEELIRRRETTTRFMERAGRAMLDSLA